MGRARWSNPPLGELEVKYKSSDWQPYEILETDYVVVCHRLLMLNDYGYLEPRKSLGNDEISS